MARWSSAGALARDGSSGTGIYNGRSQIVWRRVGRERSALDREDLRARLERAIARRDAAGGGRHRRLVWSESDELPGVVVDQFGAVLVVQIQTLAMERRSGTLIGDMSWPSGCKPAEIIFRNDATIRQAWRACPLESPIRAPASPGRSAVGFKAIDGVDYVDSTCRTARRPGFYLDQRLQHGIAAECVRRYCAGKPRVLDAFCNQGLVRPARGPGRSAR